MPVALPAGQGNRSVVPGALIDTMGPTGYSRNILDVTKSEHKVGECFAPRELRSYWRTTLSMPPGHALAWVPPTS